ncbi:hypothetical protein K503DRAFT_804676 [Rhizopogon vinicolor AM-OR11-026]|uniref:Uncharacterized protein n=1 Tax=Rhizopogon vinicolor AM-OR11-026 TaxID=1314800 RepID=A0A1B7MKD7_9AGAM|nr:hypothetical protein K503DRAFT_804676 [Rhizopogon vinicolor AM-OR11-026]
MSIVKQSSDTIKFPKGHTAYIFGSATAYRMQQVVVKVQKTSGSDLNECSFRGLNGPMAITSGGLGFVNQQAVVIPADNNKNRRLELIFSAYDNHMWATSDAEDIKGFQKNTQTSSVAPRVTSYIYRTEDGGDKDHDGTTFVVTLIADTEQVQPNGMHIPPSTSGTSSPTSSRHDSRSRSHSHSRSRSHLRSRSRHGSRSRSPA